MLLVMNQKKNHLGVYQAKTNTVQRFEDTKRGNEFFRYPQNLKEITPFKKENMMITGPVVGYNLLLAPKESPAGKKEQGLLEKN